MGLSCVEGESFEPEGLYFNELAEVFGIEEVGFTHYEGGFVVII